MPKEKKTTSNEVIAISNKWHSPFLLAASFHNLIEFRGSFIQGGQLHYQFFPKEKALELIRDFRLKADSTRLPAKDLMEAIDAFWSEIGESKRSNGAKHYGEQNY